MQRIGALQKDYDLAVGVPSLVGELFGNRCGEHRDDLRSVISHAFEVGRSEQHGEAVGRQEATARELLDVVFGFPEQRLYHFLGNDAATKDPREGIAHHPLKTALEPVDAAQPTLPPFASACCWRCRSYLC